MEIVREFLISNFKCQMSNNWKFQRAFTLIELLVSVSLFVIIGIFITQTLATILSSRQKADVAQQVEQEARYAVNVMERHLRGARSPSVSGQTITYEDSLGNVSTFACTGSSPTYIASGSARLTSTSVAVSNCSFSVSINPDKINISFTVSQFPATTDPKLTAITSIQTQVILRNR